MLIRRVVYHWQFPAAAVLPIWLLVGWGVFGGSGWGFLFLIVACIVLAVFLAVVSALIRARRSVRESRAVAWWDAAALAAWHGSLIGLGFFGPTTGLFVLLSIVLGLVAFWYALWALLTEASRRVGAALDGFVAQAQAQEAGGRRPLPPDGYDGEIIVVRERD
jgi:hypothetical protein